MVRSGGGSHSQKSSKSSDTKSDSEKWILVKGHNDSTDSAKAARGCPVPLESGCLFGE